jgi:hypothetical protein
MDLEDANKKGTLKKQLKSNQRSYKGELEVEIMNKLKNKYKKQLTVVKNDKKAEIFKSEVLLKKSRRDFEDFCDDLAQNSETSKQYLEANIESLRIENKVLKEEIFNLKNNPLTKPRETYSDYPMSPVETTPPMQKKVITSRNSDEVKNVNFDFGGNSKVVQNFQQR